MEGRQRKCLCNPVGIVLEQRCMPNTANEEQKCADSYASMHMCRLKCKNTERPRVLLRPCHDGYRNNPNLILALWALHSLQHQKMVFWPQATQGQQLPVPAPQKYPTKDPLGQPQGRND
eukprot:1160331-Pelagomonas_calceolata.AAC.7